MKWGIHPEALLEYQEAALFYAGRDQALVLRFISAVEEAIKQVVESPFAWRVDDEEYGVRRILVRRFPYAML